MKLGVLIPVEISPQQSPYLLFTTLALTVAALAYSAEAWRLREPIPCSETRDPGGCLLDALWRSRLKDHNVAWESPADHHRVQVDIGSSTPVPAERITKVAALLVDAGLTELPVTCAVVHECPDGTNAGYSISHAKQCTAIVAAAGLKAQVPRGLGTDPQGNDCNWEYTTSLHLVFHSGRK